MDWKRFRKKPVEVDAMRWDPSVMKWSDFPEEYMYGPGKESGIVGEFMGTGELGIMTLEGVMFARSGDWIIRVVKGELYPCKADIFAMVYEEA